MAQQISLSTEDNLAIQYKNEINTFWQSGKFSNFTGVDKIRINYAVFEQISNKKCLIIVPGRSESYLKYQELSYDLSQQGFNLYIIDHRGQGLSERMLNNPFKGYVKNFDDYVNDLHQLITSVVLPHCSALTEKKPYLLAHSLGGAISSLYMARYPETIKAAVLSSPMIAINSGAAPAWLAESLVKSMHFFEKNFSNNKWYFIGQTDQQFTPFNENIQTHSAVRYQIFQDLYKAQPELQLGGVTVNWLIEAISAKKQIFTELNKISTPVLVLQAGDDTIVDNEIQNDFCLQLHASNSKSCPNGQAKIIPEARHELLFEQDKYRQPAIKNILTWFAQH